MLKNLIPVQTDFLKVSARDVQDVDSLEDEKDIEKFVLNFKKYS